MDYVILNPAIPKHPLLVAEVVYMWDDVEKGPMFHAHFFIRWSDTVLGETSDPREIFIHDSCDKCPLGTNVRKAVVEIRLPSLDWAMSGGIDNLPPVLYILNFIARTTKILKDLIQPQVVSR